MQVVRECCGTEGRRACVLQVVGWVERRERLPAYIHQASEFLNESHETRCSANWFSFVKVLTYIKCTLYYTI